MHPFSLYSQMSFHTHFSSGIHKEDGRVVVLIIL